MTPFLKTVQNYVVLVKPRPTSLALIMAMVGFYMASPPEISALFWHTLWGTLLIGCGANAWNQCLERAYDAKMTRTQARPLVTGEITPAQGITFASICSVWGVFHLYFFTNTLASAMGLLLLVVYVLMYRPLKAKTSYSVYVGAVSGALPPCIGWAAAQNTLTIEAWILFGIVYAWQIPHFLAIAWIYRNDYRNAGFHMPTTEENAEKKIKLPVIGYGALLIGVSLLPSVVGMTGSLYFVLSLILGILFLTMGIRFVRHLSDNAAVQLILASVVYLCLLVTVMVIDKI